jgi:hypothetical protein
MADYSAPYMPNMLTNAYAANALNSFQQTQKTQQDVADAGETAAGGDLAGAANQLLSKGHLAEAQQIQGMARNLKADHINDLKDTYDKMGSLARMVQAEPDPDKRAQMWGDAIATAKAKGLDVSGFEHPVTGPQTALAFSGKIGDSLNDEMNRRRQQAAEFAGAQSYKTTIKGEDGTDKPAVVMRKADGTWTAPIPTPAGVDVAEPIKPADSKAPQTTQIERIADAYQASWKAEHPGGPELPRADALNAAGIATRNGQGTKIDFKPDDKGVPRLVTNGQEGTGSYTKTEQGAYNIKSSQAAATADTSIKARNQLAEVVNGHSTMLEAISRRPDFNDAMMFLRTPEGARFWSGQLADLSKVPETAMKLKMDVSSLEHEYGNFVAAGHKGGMTLEESNSLKQIVGNLYSAPDSATFRSALQNLRDLAGEFSKVKMIGPMSPSGQQPYQPPAGQPPSPLLQPIGEHNAAQPMQAPAMPQMAPQPSPQPAPGGGVPGTMVQQPQQAAPSGPQRPAGKSDAELIALAQRAIGMGKDPAAVQQQLRLWGVQQ